MFKSSSNSSLSNKEDDFVRTVPYYTMYISQLLNGEYVHPNHRLITFVFAVQ